MSLTEPCIHHDLVTNSKRCLGLHVRLKFSPPVLGRELRQHGEHSVHTARDVKVSSTSGIFMCLS
jgi:hypothetical protein